MLRRALKMTFWVMYDHLGKLMAVSLICSMALAGPVWLALGLLLQAEPGPALMPGLAVAGFAVILWFVLASGVAHLAKVLIETRDGSVGMFFHGLCLYAARAAGIGAIFVFAAACLALSAWFYAARLGASAPWFGYGVSGAAVWLLVLACAVAMFLAPALAQKRGGIGGTLRLGALLVVDNPVLAAGLMFWHLLIAVATLAPPFCVFITPALVVVLESSAYEMLARRYASVTESGGRKRPVDFGDAEDDYLNRGLRDFLFPWKS